jgi:glycosyltransferase involved in cell wall biosynthesis
MGTIDLTPLVSVMIPYYNHQAFIVEAVASVKRQTYPRIEIIIVDDGSLVPVQSILRDLPDLLIVRTENRGVSTARNTAFGLSSGDYLLFLDADDRLMPGAIEAHLESLRRDPDAGMCFGARRVINEVGEVIRQTHICRPRLNYFMMFLESNPVGSPGASLMRRDAFVEAGRFNEAFSMGEDLDLYLRIARRRRVVRHSACILEYREHSANTSAALEKMLAGTMLLLDSIEPLLTSKERQRLPYARKRWEHTFRPEGSLRYRLRALYFSFRAMLNVPMWYYWGQK